jgi:hypothetical protein
MINIDDQDDRSNRLASTLSVLHKKCSHQCTFPSRSARTAAFPISPCSVDVFHLPPRPLPQQLNLIPAPVCADVSTVTTAPINSANFQDFLDLSIQDSSLMADRSVTYDMGFCRGSEKVAQLRDVIVRSIAT